VGGSGGIGTTGNGSNGSSSPSNAGGIYISTSGTACKTADTIIKGNQADTNPNVYGTIGAC
jgi:hypothetical protein